MVMTISELAGTAGVGVETVRFYQRRGLMNDPRPAARGSRQGTRHYGAEDARRLAFIRRAQKAGFTLAEIARLLELDSGQDRQAAHAMARERMIALDAEIADLQAARRSLSRLADQCAGTVNGPCPILSAFEE